MAPTGVFCHHYSQQTESTSRFSLHITSSFWQCSKLKMPIFRLKNNTKIYTYLSSIFNTNICSKIKSLHLQQTSRSDLGIWLVGFLSTFSAGYTSANLSDFKLSLSRVEPPSTTSKISNPLNFLLLQTRRNWLGRSWNLSTKRLERWLHSGSPYLLDSIIWRLSRRETNSHLCFHSEACLYPQPSLRMPDWGLL